MRVPVAIPSPLRSYTRGAAEVFVDLRAGDERLQDALAALDAAYPGFAFRMVDERGCLRPHMQIFVDGVIERDLTAPLNPSARVMIVAALSGG